MMNAPKRLGAFETLYQLKSGGMGDVLLARRRGPGGFEQLVAVKTIRSDLMTSEAVRGMFLDEARLLARLAHPAIATVLDFGEEEGVLYLAMEYVRGIAFRDVAARKPPPAIAALAIAEACRGLHAAHELTDLGGNPLGVVHRDISPENLMLGFDGQVKVLDFGIALVKGRQTVTEHGTVKGKPPYMSPEQVRGTTLDRRSDVFSVALVLHELLTGQAVFRGDNLYQVARAVIEQPIEPPGIAGLDEPIMRALERDRDRRTPTAAALAEELTRAAGASESLVSWASRALAADRDAHRAWLAGVVGGAAARPVGRASGVVTAAADVGPAASGLGPREPEPRSEPVRDPDTDPEPPRRRTWVPFAIVTLFLMGGALALVLKTCGGAPAPASDATVATAPPPDAAVVVVVADATAIPIDATVIASAPVDAAPVKRPRAPIDAGRRVRVDAAVREAPQPDAAPPAPAEHGYITITADPFALIRIDGKDWGTTPIYKRRISAGPHTVDLVTPDSHEVRLHREIEVAPGALTKINL